MKNWIEFWFNSIFNFAKVITIFEKISIFNFAKKSLERCKSMSIFESLIAEMLQNAYLLANFGFDTAENEPLKVWGGDSIQYSIPSLIKGPAGPRV